jgi:hypothetical protein
MICPNCKCEYIRGVTQCADCGVPLVNSLDSAIAGPPDQHSVVAVWQGDDPAECAAVKNALAEAEIPFVDQSSNAYFILRSMRPKTEVCVRIVDEEAARKVLLGVKSGTSLDELTPEEIESLALPVSDAPDHDDAPGAPADATADLDVEEHLSEVWQGDNEDMANTLIMCLRENGIPSRKNAEVTGWLLEVRPELASRAKEIVREVVEASPPE